MDIASSFAQVHASGENFPPPASALSPRSDGREQMIVTETPTSSAASSSSLDRFSEAPSAPPGAGVSPGALPMSSSSQISPHAQEAAVPGRASTSGNGSGADGVVKDSPASEGVKDEPIKDGAAKEGGGSRPPKRPRDTPLPVGLPKSMVRRIMKLGEDTRNISNEALVMVVKASELFLEKFAATAFSHAEQLGRRTIKYQDVSDVRVQDPNLLFLEAVVPP